MRRRRCLNAVLAAALLLGTARAWAGGLADRPAPDAPSDEQLFPRGQQHFRRCWQLEHDYYALRREIAHAGVVWHRQQLEQWWEEVRDQRRGSCLMGW